MTRRRAPGTPCMGHAGVLGVSSERLEGHKPKPLPTAPTAQESRLSSRTASGRQGGRCPGRAATLGRAGAASEPVIGGYGRRLAPARLCSQLPMKLVAEHLALATCRRQQSATPGSSSMKCTLQPMHAPCMRTPAAACTLPPVGMQAWCCSPAAHTHAPPLSRPTLSPHGIALTPENQLTKGHQSTSRATRRLHPCSPVHSCWAYRACCPVSRHACMHACRPCC